MISTLTREFGAGTNLISSTDCFIAIITEDGAVQIYLPSILDYSNYSKNSSGNLLFQGFRFIDISNLAATNNITIYAAVGDTINGASSVTLSTNGISGLISASGGNGWMVFLGSSSSGGNSPSVINPQTGNYTLALIDEGAIVTLTSMSGINLTVPNNSSVAYTIGNSTSLQQGGAGQVTIVPEAGVTILSSGGNIGSGGKNKLLNVGSGASITKMAINTWWLVGELTT